MYWASSSLLSESLSESDPQSMESSLPTSSSWGCAFVTFGSVADGSVADFLKLTGPVSSSDSDPLASSIKKYVHFLNYFIYLV